MPKLKHEVRCGVHGFIIFNQLEKQLLDSKPVQRLRCIHQLAMCYQIYPGATHNRFEHSLGVMEIAGRIFDRLFDDRVSDEVQERIGQEIEDRQYWREVVRAAGLLHDVGHLPFSHAAEEALLPAGWNHERLTVELIRKSEIADILRRDKPGIDPEDVVDVAWDVKKRAKAEPGKALTPWKTLLNEIVCGNTFGADRIDYLLRDSWHAGVAYGRFDPDRLISGLTVVINPEDEEIAIGLDIGAIHTAEALLLARYFMYTQVYFHDVRRVYDLHLKEFLQAWLPDAKFSADWTELLQMTDHEVLSAMRRALANEADPCHELADRALGRRHFRTVYQLISPHKKIKPTILDVLVQGSQNEFGSENIRSDGYGPKSEANDFLVKTSEGEVNRSLLLSSVVAHVPPVEIGLIFAHPKISGKVQRWLDNRVRALVSN